jgi:hypothetical protein
MRFDAGDLYNISDATSIHSVVAPLLVSFSLLTSWPYLGASKQLNTTNHHLETSNSQSSYPGYFAAVQKARQSAARLFLAALSTAGLAGVLLILSLLIGLSVRLLFSGAAMD